MYKLKSFPIVLLLILALGLLAACGGSPRETGKSSFTLASTEGMPAEILNSPQTVLDSYRFAAANPDVLNLLPCYCGCGEMGHTSNYACYIKERDQDGKIFYDTHALGCSICVDITQDAMRMLNDGRSISEIRLFVDENYSKFGPSNMPPVQ